MPDKYRTTRTPLSRRATSLALVLVTAGSPTLACAAAPTIPGFYGKVPMPSAPVSGTLPVVRAGSAPSGATVNTLGNTLTVNQTQAQATIDWNSFNIAPDSVVIFNQRQNGAPQTSWAALNRIHDASPSLIYGKIQADGRVYLINRNGILFGPGSRVNVHSLAASNLSLTDQNFQNGRLRFTTAAGEGEQELDAGAFVSNYGTIETGSGGSVFLIGPNVVNAGTISSPSGKISMIGAKSPEGGGAGEVEAFEITLDANGKDVSYSDLQVAGAAYNAEQGRLITEAGGRINMYGATVQTDGLIRAVTAFKKGGVIVLAARDKVTTGSQSRIESPIQASQETADPQFTFKAPEVYFQGLATDAKAANALSLIEHRGDIVAPSGKVTLTATERVYLGEESSIDVSGLWLDRAASANLMEVQLNSVDMRDDYGQKDGALRGDKIYVDVLTGSSIGNLDNSYLTRQTGAEERSTAGGTITLGSPLSIVTLDQLIVKEGALLDFSGGGIRYGSGAMATSHLIAGNRVYAIGSAPQWVAYDGLADSQSRVHRPFGVTEKYSGLYFGGASSVRDLTAARVAGSDAGSVLFNARVSVLDGTLAGGVTRGHYQTGVHEYATKDQANADYRTYAISAVRGLEQPKGGTVTVGTAMDAEPSSLTAYESDPLTNRILVLGQTPALDASFGAESTLDRSDTLISASLLNAAGLSGINLFARNEIFTGADANLSLLPGGSYVARSRAIDFNGSLEAPGGKVEMTTRPVLSGDAPHSVLIASGSSISTAGQRIDNSRPGLMQHESTPVTHTAGGAILIQERSQTGISEKVGDLPATGHALVVADGALLDVSGGWSIDGNGKVAGADAGTLELKGTTLSLAGELRGHSLVGRNGGEIKLHAGEVVVDSASQVFPANLSPGAPIPEYLLGRLVLGGDLLADTGFSRIALTAIEDVVFRAGVTLAPSLAKLSQPVPNLFSQRQVGNLVLPLHSDQTAAGYLGKSSIAVTAGVNIFKEDGLSGNSNPSPTARILLSPGAAVVTGAGGSIDLNARYIDLAGRLEAPGGKISATSTNELTLQNGAQVLAGGYLEPSSAMVAGLPAGPAPRAGGQVSLTSTTADLRLEAGSLVDVSGSGTAERIAAGADGVPVPVTAAAEAGSLQLSFAGELFLDGAIDGRPRAEGVQGGSLAVTKIANDLTLKASDMMRYQQSGFDALTFKSSTGSILFGESMDVAVGRSLTLDAARIAGINGVDVSLESPWTTLQNSSQVRSTAPGSLAESGALSLAGGFVDVKGSVLVQGFREVQLSAERDLSFSDRTYTVGSNSNFWAGDLGVTGNLTLAASRVFPTTASAFTVTTPGRVAILPGATADLTPVYSAGGSLTVKAQGGIEHAGAISAPMGSVTLDGGQGRVTLAEGSSIDTSGSFAVRYGYYDGSYWKVKADSFNNGGTEVVSAPSGSVTLNGAEVAVQEGAAIDVSAGGSVFYANFQSGIAGSKNPLTVVSPSPRYVVLPDRSVTLPGRAIYLEAVPELGLEAGVYSLLPADLYAFVLGALVVQDAGMQLVSGQRGLSGEGHLVVAGYGTVTGTSIAADSRKGYSVRSAADVLKEGDFGDVKEFSAKSGGDITLSATSALMNGALSGGGLADGEGGVLTLGARNVVVQSGAASAQTLVDQTLVLDTASVSGKGFAELVIGSDAAGPRTTVTVKEGATLAASSVTLRATGSVTIEKDAGVLATGEAGRGIASIEVPKGTFALNEGADVHASHGLSFDVGDMTLNGSFGADNSSLSLVADRIVFAPDGTPHGAGALYLTDSRWKQFKEYEELTLKSRGEMQFLNDVSLASAGSLTLDAGRFVGSAGAASVSFSAETRLTLTNTGATPTAEPAAGSTDLALSAAEIVVAPRRLEGSSQGDIVFDGFASVSMTARSADPEVATDILLSGAGSVKTAGGLTLSGARMATTYYRHDADPADPADLAVPYTAAAIALLAGGDVSIAGNGGKAGEVVTPGGSLSITGANVTVGNTEPVKNAKGEPVLDADKKPVYNPTVLQVPSGQLRLAATGDIVVTDKASIVATGSKSENPMQEKVYSYAPAGSIALESETGAVTLAHGSTLDVSASDEGDAGSISLAAAAGGVTLAGTLKGSAQAGQGGSFALDGKTLAFAEPAPNGTPNLDGTGWLNGLGSRLDAGGFNDRIEIRSRLGNLALTEGNTLAGREVTLAADGADITITGTVDADAAEGGRIALYAGRNLTLGNRGTLTARGTAEGSDGGSVLLSSRDGADNEKTFEGSYALTVADGSTIDVSSRDANGAGGTVLLRAYQGKRSTGDPALNDINIAAVGGTITGAAAVSVEAVKAESFEGDTVLVQAKAAGDTTAGKVGLDDYTTAAETFMAGSAAGIVTRLNGSKPGSVTALKAGIEIATAAGKSLTVGDATATDALTLAARPGGGAAVLTLKSGGDLKVVQSLSDAPTAATTLYSDTMKETTAFTLIAGSDQGADYLGVARGAGDLIVDGGKWIYTENAPVNFAAGRDAVFRGIPSAASGPGVMINADMKYNLGSYGGEVRGFAGRDLALANSGSAIQTALGDVVLRAGRNLNLGAQANTGAIRTTGEYDRSARIEIMPGAGTLADAGPTSYWTYRDGGAISLDVAGSILGNLRAGNGWDGAYYDDKTVNTATDARLVTNSWYLAAGFGGLKERAQTANIPVTVGIATMGGGDIDVRAGGSLLTQVGAFGTRSGGDLTVTSGGDMIGRFRVMNGTATLTSGGAFGKDSAAEPTWKSVIEMGAADVKVTAQGDVALGAVLNPDNSRERIFQSLSLRWNMTYSPDASVELRSLAGDLTLFGQDNFNAYNFTGSDPLKTSLLLRQRILPAHAILAAAGDLSVRKNFYLAPSESGNLALYAGGDIAGVFDNEATGFKMIDVGEVASYYGWQTDTGAQHSDDLSIDPSATRRRSTVNHLGDTVPVRVAAGGNIETLKLVLDKQSDIRAEKNIVSLDLLAQNQSPESVTRVSAGQTIDQGILTGNTSQIKIGGPGTMLVEAGERIDLGNSKGIESIGNAYNRGFVGDDTDSSLIVSAGANPNPLPEDTDSNANPLPENTDGNVTLVAGLANGTNITVGTGNVLSAEEGSAAAFFDTLREAGENYSRLKAEGKGDEAAAAIDQARAKVNEYFDVEAGKGDITMVDSLIRSRKGNVYVLAGGEVNVGRSNISDTATKKDTGITTTFGGDLSIFTGGDLNVNESRTMTFMGGDIVIWSDRGDINAGRGSKTALSGANLDVIQERDPVTNVLTGLLYPAPALGSGVRASTYDPDGSTGPRQMPEPGDVYLFAPTGIIDAGEAGIAGGNVVLGATQVINVANISFTGASVGVPSSDASISLGALAGNSSLTEGSKMSEQASGLGPVREKQSQGGPADDFFSRWLDLKIIGFDGEQREDEEEKEKQKQKK